MKTSLNNTVHVKFTLFILRKHIYIFNYITRSVFLQITKSIPVNNQINDYNDYSFFWGHDDDCFFVRIFF